MFTLISGHHQMPYSVTLLVKSFLKYNNAPIIICENGASNLDLPVEFIQYQADPLQASYKYIRIGLGHCKTKYALITHADIMFTGQVKLPEQDFFMCGIGGGIPDILRKFDNCSLARFHEWFLLIDVKEFLESGYSFAPTQVNGINYDVGAYLYKQAQDRILLPYLNEPIVHFGMGGHHRHDEVEANAKSLLSTI